MKKLCLFVVISLFSLHAFPLHAAPDSNRLLLVYAPDPSTPVNYQQVGISMGALGLSVLLHHIHSFWGEKWEETVLWMQETASFLVSLQFMVMAGVVGGTGGLGYYLYSHRSSYPTLVNTFAVLFSSYLAKIFWDLVFPDSDVESIKFESMQIVTSTLRGQNATRHPSSEELQSISRDNERSFSPPARDARKLIEGLEIAIDKKSDDALKFWRDDQPDRAVSKLAVLIYNLYSLYPTSLRCNLNLAVQAREAFWSQISWGKNKEEEELELISKIIEKVKSLKMQGMLLPQEEDYYKTLLNFWSRGNCSSLLASSS